MISSRGRRQWLVLVAVVIIAVVGPGCSRLQRHFSGGSPTRHGVITVSPPNGPTGTVFTLAASGFLPGEAMTFEIDVSKGTRFVGPRHVAGADGKGHDELHAAVRQSEGHIRRQGHRRPRHSCHRRAPRVVSAVGRSAPCVNVGR